MINYMDVKFKEMGDELDNKVKEKDDNLKVNLRN